MTEDEMQAALAREDVCRYLAACYYEPEPMFAEEGLFESLRRSASLVHRDLVPHAVALGEAFVGTTAEELLVDYTRLFLGPVRILAKPYGSVWLDEDPTLMGRSSLAVLDLYQACGFDIEPAFRDLPDHIAVELEFLYLLLFRANEARLGGNEEKARAEVERKGRFLDQHLGRWVAPFTKAVETAAQTAFYRELARTTRLFVGMEAQRDR